MPKRIPSAASLAPAVVSAHKILAKGVVSARILKAVVFVLGALDIWVPDVCIGAGAVLSVVTGAALRVDPARVGKCARVHAGPLQSFKTLVQDTFIKA